MTVFLIIIAVLALTQLLVLGVMGGIGPFGFIRANRIAKHPGNAEEYDFSHIEPMTDSPLAGKNVCVLGSSVVFGSASQEQAVAEYLSARYGANVTKEAVSGTTLADTRKNSYVCRMKSKLDTAALFDLFICQLSTNDATMKLPLGEIADGTSAFDTATVTGAMEYIIGYVREHWNCPIVFFTAAHYDSPEYGAMVERLKQLQKKWGIGILDLWSDCAFNGISAEKRKLYMSDRIHPTKAGYSLWWGPELERQLNAFLGS